jgi:hypothetical protein
MQGKRMLMLGLFVVVLLCCLCVYAGCSIGGDETSDEPEEDTTIKCEFPNEDLVGIPLYKNNVDASSIKGTMDRGSEGLEYVSVDYTTSDDFATVVSWCEKELGAPAETSTLPDGNSEALWREMEGEFVKITIVTQTKDGTAISVMRDKV